MVTVTPPHCRHGGQFDLGFVARGGHALEALVVCGALGRVDVTDQEIGFRYARQRGAGAERQRLVEPQHDASTLARRRTRRRVADAARPPVIATTFLDRERG